MSRREEVRREWQGRIYFLNVISIVKKNQIFKSRDDYQSEKALGGTGTNFLAF